jgi:TP901 family phage tail tape measure protein
MAINLGSAYGKISIDSSGVTRGVNAGVASLNSLNSKAQELGMTLKRNGAAMTAAFTLPVLAAGRSAINTFKDYEKAMNVLGAVTDATASQMEELSALAKDLGADISLPGTSAADAAEAMAELAKAGLNINEVMAAAKGVLQMSAAGQLGNAEAAEITANALNVFNLQGSEAVRVADLLAAAANSSSGEVRDMADALQMSASVFATADMEIEELVAAISLMSNAGIQGSDAGTSLKQMLLSLQAPSKKAKELMQELGINIYDANGNMLDMRSIIDIFSTQMSSLTQEQRNLALATIFGSDAVRAANIVLMGGVEAYDAMLGKVTEVGAASKLASALMEGLTGSMENLKSAFETAAIAAIEPLKDDLKVLIDFAVKLLNAFADLPAPVREGIVKFILFLAVLGPILIVLGSLLPLLGGLTKSLNPFNGGILGLIGTFLKLLSFAAIVVKVLGAFGISTGVVGVKILALQAAVAGVGTSLLALLAPFALVIATITLIYLLWKNWDTLGVTIKQLGFIISFVFKQVYVSVSNTLKQLWFIIKFGFGQMWATLKAGSAEALQNLLNAWNTWIEQNKAKFNGWVMWIQTAWQNILKFFAKARDYIVQTFQKMDWSMLGRYVMLGLANGILGGIPLIIAAGTKAGQAALTALRRALDSHSPSKKAEQEGENLSQGFANGIQNSMALLEKNSPYQRLLDLMNANTKIAIAMSKNSIDMYYEAIGDSTDAAYKRQMEMLTLYLDNLRKYYQSISKMGGNTYKNAFRSLSSTASSPAAGAIAGINVGSGNIPNWYPGMEIPRPIPVEQPNLGSIPVEQARSVNVEIVQNFSSGLTTKQAEKMVTDNLDSMFGRLSERLAGT